MRKSKKTTATEPTKFWTLDDLPPIEHTPEGRAIFRRIVTIATEHQYNEEDCALPKMAKLLGDYNRVEGRKETDEQRYQTARFIFVMVKLQQKLGVEQFKKEVTVIHRRVQIKAIPGGRHA